MKLPKPIPQSYTNRAADFASGKDTPTAFLQRCLANVEVFEPTVGAFVHLEVEKARAVAAASTVRWREGRQLSRIDGMPVGIKDLIETADMPTQCGSPVFEGYRSHRDAASVLALRQAGAIILGKTVTTEFAAKVPRGTRNPWDPARTPGGSSSGSAAGVGCGMIAAGLGTQVIGSLLRPASYCGAYAFKPTFGAINRGGSHDGLSQSAHGPITASLQDAWLVAREISDRAGGDPGYPGLYGPSETPAAVRPSRIVVIETAGWKVAEPEAKAAIEAAVQRLAAEGVRVQRRNDDARIALLEVALEDAGRVSHALVNYESVWPLNTYRDRDPSKLSSFLRDRLVEAEKMTQADYRKLLATRAAARAAHAMLLGECDVLLTLAAPGGAPLGIDATGDTVFNIPATYLGAPALSLPLMTVQGLPLGLQAIGFMDRDAELFESAGWIDQVLR